MNITAFPETRWHEVAWVRGVTNAVREDIDFLASVSAKARKGVASARKVETATFRYARFLGQYKAVRLAAMGQAQRLAHGVGLDDFQRTAGEGVVASLFHIEASIDNGRPWIALPSVEGFKFNVAATLDVLDIEFVIINSLCRQLLGERGTGRAA